jgi:GTP cyclohydrolase I
VSVDRAAAARAVVAFLKALGRDPDREPELAETGKRVADAWADELLAGYGVDVDALLEESALAGSADGTSPASPERGPQTELVAVRDVPVVTMCPHHLLPARGRAVVMYAPGGRLVGVGTLAAVVDAYARRLALQERIGEEVVAALVQHLKPRWAACQLLLEHGCMTARGERAHGARVETIAFLGPAADKAAAYALLLGARDGAAGGGGAPPNHSTGGRG